MQAQLKNAIVQYIWLAEISRHSYLIISFAHEINSRQFFFFRIFQLLGNSHFIHIICIRPMIATENNFILTPITPEILIMFGWVFTYSLPGIRKMGKVAILSEVNQQTFPFNF